MACLEDDRTRFWILNQLRKKGHRESLRFSDFEIIGQLLARKKFFWQAFGLPIFEDKQLNETDF